MKKQQLDHLLRAAGRITKDKQFVIVGSQSLHGKQPDLPDQLLVSLEADLIAKNHPERTSWLEAIGVGSRFHDEFGYYADPVDEHTAVLPKGWQGRLVNLPGGDTGGVTGLCLDPHDLAISKYVANREKDRVFLQAMIVRKVIDQDRLLALLDTTPMTAAARKSIRLRIQTGFAHRGKPA